MKRILLALALLAADTHFNAMAGQAPLLPGNYRVFGVGNGSCGDWRSKANGSADHLLHVTWINGFLSGVGYAASQDVRDVDNHAIEAWMNDYCATHPLIRLSTATAALATELKQ